MPAPRLISPAKRTKKLSCRDVGEEISGLRFNRAIAHIYELTNVLAKFLPEVEKTPNIARIGALRDGIEQLIVMISPFMPHLAETCWRQLGKKNLVADALWPKIDETLLVKQTTILPVQINGKRRGEIEVPVDAQNTMIESKALSLAAVSRILDGRPPKKLIIVPNRIVNVVA